MKSIWLSVAFLLAGCATFPGMETHQYHLDGSILSAQTDSDDGGIFVDMSNAREGQNRSDTMRSFLTAAGMTFPEGAKITVNPQNSIVTLRNTPENHAQFKKLFNGSGHPLYQQID